MSGGFEEGTHHCYVLGEAGLVKVPVGVGGEEDDG